MRIIAHGIDLVDFGRIEKMLEKHPHRFLDRVFTPTEQADADKNKTASKSWPVALPPKKRS